MREVAAVLLHFKVTWKRHLETCWRSICLKTSTLNLSHFFVFVHIGVCTLRGRLYQAVSGSEWSLVKQQFAFILFLLIDSFCSCLRVPTWGMTCLKTLRRSARGSTSRWPRSSAAQRQSWPNSSRISLRTNYRYVFQWSIVLLERLFIFGWLFILQAHVKEKLDGTRHSDAEQYLKNLYDLYTRWFGLFFSNLVHFNSRFYADVFLFIAFSGPQRWLPS